MTLDRWLIRRIAAATGLAAALLVGLAVVARLGQVASVPASFTLLRTAPVAALVAWIAVPLAAFALPLALFAGATTVLARFRESGGWDAFRLAGASPARLLPAMLVSGAVVGVLSGALAAWGEPWGRYGLRAALAEAGRGWGPLADGPVDVEAGGWRLLGRVEGGRLVDVMVLAEGGAAGTAATGEMSPVPGGGALRVVLEEGQWVLPDPAFGEGRMRFGRLVLDVPLRGGRPSRGAYELFPGDLRELVARNAALGRSDPGPALAWHKRMAFPASSLVLVLLAVPAGLHGRRGGLGRSVLLALAAGLAWYGAMRWGDGAVRAPPRGIGLPPAVAAWVPAGVLLPPAAVGWFLLHRVPRGARR